MNRARMAGELVILLLAAYAGVAIVACLMGAH